MTTPVTPEVREVTSSAGCNHTIPSVIPEGMGGNVVRWLEDKSNLVIASHCTLVAICPLEVTRIVSPDEEIRTSVTFDSGYESLTIWWLNR
jgi:hypothetical protein